MKSFEKRLNLYLILFLIFLAFIIIFLK
jgi:hypothetical protein